MGPTSQRKAILLVKLASVNAQHYIKILPAEKSEFIEPLSNTSPWRQPNHPHGRKRLVICGIKAKVFVKFG
jgi:hypothetical protein